jgi:hypothetical protein
MKSYEAYAALYIKHKRISGIIIHCYCNTFVEYSLIAESLGHGLPSKIRIMSYKKMKKLLKKVSKG